MTTSESTETVAATDATKAGKRIVRKPKVHRMAQIPSFEEYASNYVHRKFEPGLDDFIVFDFAKAHHKNVLIEGPTGNGKTSAIYAWAATRGYHVYSISSHIGLEPSQLFGKYIFDEDTGKAVWQDGPVTDIVRHGGVLLFNEVNFIPERIGTVAFSLLDKRREIQLVDHKGEIIKAHPNCVFFADMNPDYQGTRQLNAAFRNRFDIQLVWDYDPAVEAQLIKCDSLRKLAAQIRDRIKSGDFETPVSTNMLFEFEKNARYLGPDFAKGLFINHFSADDRGPVSKVIDTHWSEIVRELKGLGRVTPYGDDFIDEDGLEYGTGWVYGDEDEEGSTEQADPNQDFDVAEAVSVEK